PSGISMRSSVVPGNLLVVMTSLSPVVFSISLLIRVDFPTFVVPTTYTSWPPANSDILDQHIYAFVLFRTDDDGIDRFDAGLAEHMFGSVYDSVPVHGPREQIDLIDDCK